MNLKQYFDGKDYGSKAAMAKTLGISKTWMSQLISGRVQCSPALAKAFEEATGGLVKRADLRPDLFA